MKPIQFLLLAFVLAALTKVIYSYTQRRIQRRGFLFWTLVWMGTATIITFPDATSFLAHILGIGRGADLIIYTSLLISFYLILRIHLLLARLEQEVTEIVRAIALERLTEMIDSGSREDESAAGKAPLQEVSSWSGGKKSKIVFVFRSSSSRPQT